MPLLMSDFREGQSQALAAQYAPKQYQQEEESRQLALDITKRKEADVLGEANDYKDIMSKNLLPATPEPAEDKRGGYMDPDVAKMQELVKTKSNEVKAQQESKAKLSALMQSAMAHHNPAAADSYRKQIDGIEDKSKADALQVITTQSLLDEEMGKFAGSIKANPDSYKSTVLEMAAKGVIPPDVGMRMLNATPEQQSKMVDAAIAKADTSKIRAQLAIAASRAEIMKTRESNIETREKDRNLFKEKEFQMKKDNIDWMHKDKIGVENKAAAKEHYTTLKDEVATAEKEHTANVNAYATLLKDRDDLQARLALNVSDATVKAELEDIQKKMDKAEVWINDSASDVLDTRKAEKEFAKKLGVPASSSTDKVHTGVKVGEEFNKAADAIGKATSNADKQADYAEFKKRWAAASKDPTEQKRLEDLAREGGLLK